MSDKIMSASKNICIGSILLLSMFYVGCNDVTFVDLDGPSISEEDSIAQALVDQEIINKYLSDKGLSNANENALGMRYALLSPGNGTFPDRNDIVSVNFILKFPNDSIIDTNMEDLAKAVPISKENLTYAPLVFNFTADGSVVSFPGQYGYLGLMSGIRNAMASATSLMDESSKAVVLLPSQQGLGISGYSLTSGFRIPPNQVLVLEMIMVRVRKD